MSGDQFKWLELDGKICVITGAAGGLGIGFAVNFARAGAKVVLLDLKQSGLDLAADEVRRATGVEALTIPCDVSKPEAVAAAAKLSAERAGPCDILINNAAITRQGTIETASFEDWSLQLGVNLNGYFLCSQTFGKQMKGRGGSIIHVSSICGSHPRAAGCAYSVAKAGVNMLSRQIAQEWGAEGIRSNTVSPGLVETPLSAATYAIPAMRAAREAAVPLGRIAQPQDIAETALFLASSRASYISGEDFLIDGAYGTKLMSFVPRAQ